MATFPTLPAPSPGDAVQSSHIIALAQGVTFIANASGGLFDGSQLVTQSLTSGAETAITLTNENVDTDGGHSNSTNTNRYTANTAGRYWVSGQVCYAANGTGVRYANIRKNGSTQVSSQQVPSAGAGVPTFVGAPARLVFLAAGDYVELLGLQTSGGALSTALTNSASWLSVYLPALA